ncbi:MAG: VOC family protein [Pseudomonadota bacterium]
MIVLDHLVITAANLEEGTREIETLLGLPLAPGGRHDAFGTHNRLLSLGPELYLEVIAIDPDAPPPGRIRWYNLDGAKDAIPRGGQTGPLSAARFTHWAVRSDTFEADLSRALPGTGTPLSLQRGDFRWRMAVPETGRLPLDDVAPAYLTWESAHPAPRLPDLGVRLERLEIIHPAVADLPLPDDPRVQAKAGPRALGAVLSTPNGPKRLPS